MKVFPQRRKDAKIKNFEARNPKRETNSNGEEIQNYKQAFGFLVLDFLFWISKFGFGIFLSFLSVVLDVRTEP